MPKDQSTTKEDNKDTNDNANIASSSAEDINSAVAKEAVEKCQDTTDTTQKKSHDDNNTESCDSGVGQQDSSPLSLTAEMPQGLFNF